MKLRNMKMGVRITRRRNDVHGE